MTRQQKLLAKGHVAVCRDTADGDRCGSWWLSTQSLHLFVNETRFLWRCLVCMGKYGLWLHSSCLQYVLHMFAKTVCAKQSWDSLTGGSYRIISEDRSAFLCYSCSTLRKDASLQNNIISCTNWDTWSMHTRRPAVDTSLIYQLRNLPSSLNSWQAVCE